MNGRSGKIDCYLMRHGEPEGGQRWRGSTDYPLNDDGWQQMRTSFARLDMPFAKIYSSPLSRCRAFAEEIGAMHGIETQIDEDLREYEFGSWENRLSEELWQEQPEQVLAFWRDPWHHPPPGGEEPAAYQKRVGRAWQRLQRQEGKKIMVVSHGGTIRMLLCHALGLDYDRLWIFDVRYASVARLRVEFYPDEPPRSRLISLAHVV